MNFKYILWVTVKILFVEGLFMLPSAAVSIIYREYSVLWYYLAVSIFLMALGAVSFFVKPKNNAVRAREGLAVAGLAWLAVSLFGAVPPWLTGEIPSYLDSVFETVSGFTTTGASILTDVEALSNTTLFWRSFTHWIGGMGVLVFVLAIMRVSDDKSMHLMRAEVPGHQAGKLVSKMRLNSRILYLIYIALSLVQFVLLILGGMDVFDSLLNTFATAGTGGFAIKNASIAFYNSAYVDWVITVFMLLFSVNFNLFYFILIRNFRDVLKNEEIKWFGAAVIGAVALITLNTMPAYQSFSQALRYSAFTVASLISTTGFATADYNLWPGFSQAILILIMFIGACSGSTGGGIKVSRVVILFKSAVANVRKQISPRSVQPVKFEGKLVDPTIQSGIMGYLVVYIIIFILSFTALSLDKFSLVTSFTAVTACLNNIGPGLEAVGPTGNFSGFEPLSKIVLIFDMLAGRLELFPMIALLYPGAWRRK